ncbi:hypothetical protein QUC31_010291 [Theobroma cacao]|uniref:RING-type E3 ubiquitin transferase n=1 Tax=Theobroma cacao TaxID=3641 RepID=A0AB32WDR0_THECC|nr:PREDICTED: probable E3 ubiquitin-protein ligase RHG1A [Theobroma cacao]
MSGNIFDNYCQVWEVDETRVEDELLESSIFSIDVHASFTYPNQDCDDEEDDLDIECYDSVTIRRTHEVQFDYMNSDPRSAIRDMLVSMHVPVEDFMIAEISKCAGRMSTKDCYKNRKVLRMCVSIDVMVGELPFPIDKPTTTPASKEAIRRLEKVVIENPMACAICLDDLSIGSEAKRMPCSHLFHGRCIVHWLGMSKFCPICRFEMPS